MDNERESLVMRAKILRGYITAVEQPEKLLQVCAAATGTVDDVRVAVATAFGVNDITAEAILDLQVRRFAPTTVAQMKAELAENERRLADLDLVSNVPAAPNEADRREDGDLPPRHLTASAYGIFLNGAYGVGKSSVLDHLGDLFARHQLAFSLFDVDWFHRSWPTASHDPRNVVVEAENMRATWENYLLTGPRTPLIAGIIETADDLVRYEEVFQRELRMVLLTASPRVAEDRLRRRYDRDRYAALSWHLARHRDLASRLETGHGYVVTVDTDELTPAGVAASIFDALRPGES
ncbi:MULTISPECIES: hypothetical protein [Microbacterium]|uniref:hypothetical protein n=1 Tax=Microbacterium TaxID=33882 RepID=UPI0023DAD3E1|nr:MULTISPECIES: hypothetical protein [Microbacterium]MDF2045430.1 hypothetical protein [Microbacterium sp. Kw_RZR3]